VLNKEIQFPWNISGQSIAPAYIAPATINKEHIDPCFMEEINKLQAEVKHLTKLVNQLYYPYRSNNE
jgi:hypothetical protein